MRVWDVSQVQDMIVMMTALHKNLKTGRFVQAEGITNYHLHILMMMIMMMMTMMMISTMITITITITTVIITMCLVSPAVDYDVVTCCIPRLYYDSNDNDKDNENSDKYYKVSSG